MHPPAQERHRATTCAYGSHGDGRKRTDTGVCLGSGHLCNETSKAADGNAGKGNGNEYGSSADIYEMNWQVGMVDPSRPPTNNSGLIGGKGNAYLQIHP